MSWSRPTLLVAHVGGWLSLGLARAASLRPIVEPEVWVRLAPEKLAGAVIGLLTSSVLGLGYERLFKRNVPPPRAPFVMGPLLGAVVWVSTQALVVRPLITGDAPHVEWARVPFSLISPSLLLFAWTGLYLAVRFAHEAERRSSDAMRAEAEAHQAKLLALHYQLSPHFLFNALNAIRGLSTTAPERSREVIGRLASFLRYSLDTEPDRSVNLAEEMEAIRHFAEIEKARFAERVAFVFDVDEEALRMRVPPLVMLPIVENATKHGEPGSDGVLRVEVAIQAVKGGFQVVVSNTGTLDAHIDSRSHGLGIPNVDARMSHAFAGRYQRRTFEDGGRVVTQLEVAGG